MNFVPPVPQFTQQTYGMNFGDWQQYAGFGKAKPFGGPGMPMDRSGQAIPQAVPAPMDDTNPKTPVVPYTTKPGADYSPYGGNPNNAFGTNSNGNFGAPSSTSANKSASDLLNEHYD
jgi:hypothetical protein